MDRTFESKVLQVCGPLLKAAVLKVERIETPESLHRSIGPDSRVGSPDIPEGAAQLEASEDFVAWGWLEVAQFAFCERFHRGDTIVLSWQAPIFKMNARIRLEHGLRDLYRNYETLRELVQQARLRAEPTSPFGDWRSLPCFWTRCAERKV